MHLESLQVFCDVARTRSFSEAAALHHITQSAVSQQLRALEKRLGAQLLERTNRGVTVTPEGKTLVEAAEKISDLFEEVVRRIEQMRGRVSGVLRISTVYSIGLHELPPHVKRFRQTFPDVQVAVSYRKASQVYHDVAHGAADFGLVAFPKPRRGLAVDVYAMDRLVVICNPNHQLAAQKAVQLSDLSGQTLVAFEPDAPTRQALDKWFKSDHIHVHRTMEFDNVETVKRAVEVEDAVSIVPRRSVTREVTSGTLVALEIKDKADEAWRPLGILRRRSRALTPPMEAFRAALRDGEAELGADGK